MQVDRVLTMSAIALPLRSTSLQASYKLSLCCGRVSESRSQDTGARERIPQRRTALLFWRVVAVCVVKVEEESLELHHGVAQLLRCLFG